MELGCLLCWRSVGQLSNTQLPCSCPKLLAATEAPATHHLFMPSLLSQPLARC